MANIIQKIQKPTLILAHNKTLAGQLYSEFKEFFPENAVEYFVSYYDYYQPESYIASSDTYIEKDSSVNDEIDILRHSATAALFETRDVIIVASVSCIYGLGDPIDYEHMTVSLRPGMKIERNVMLKKLINMQYSRNELDFKRGTFRAKGDIVEIFPSDYGESAIRVEFWGDEVEKISEINPLTGKSMATRSHIMDISRRTCRRPTGKTASSSKRFSKPRSALPAADTTWWWTASSARGFCSRGSRRHGRAMKSTISSCAPAGKKRSDARPGAPS